MKLHVFGFSSKNSNGNSVILPEIIRPSRDTFYMGSNLYVRLVIFDDYIFDDFIINQIM